MNEAIQHLIETFNTGWTKGEFNTVETILHEDAIFIAPDLTTEIVGKKACLETIKAYTRQAKTLSFEVEDQKVNIWNRTANISMNYYIEYTMNGKKYREKGKEFWTLSRENNDWKLVWRAMVNNEKIK